ncbi:sugar nucleotide-binding protein [Halalkalibacillus halophilus]|uniref:sugar nucleotide-binding protein n=1 Tax=Halalkalibacillus halophilus TaxID=392827 RepID=UPI000403EED2|nr:sugar nucleotide-binding protein [Halalkalibacillus halophilus]
MKILILGARGFLGSNLIRLIEGSKYTVLGTSRSVNEKSNIIKLDVTDKISISQTIKNYQPDTIIWSLLGMENEDSLINIGLSNLLSSIPSETKLIFISTDAVFSEGNGGYLELDNTHPMAGDSPLSTYVNSKINGERMIQENHPNHIIIRPGPIYGGHSYENMEIRTQKVIRQVEEKYFFNAAANLYRTFVHIEDLSNAILEIINIDFHGILHMASQEKLSYFAFYTERLSGLGYSEDVIRPIKVDVDNNSDIILDTSLNTHKVNRLLKTRFR